jgi:hypothetical protein
MALKTARYKYLLKFHFLNGRNEIYEVHLEQSLGCNDYGPATNLARFLTNHYP